MPLEASTMDKKVLIYTDGACRGNPGPGGWAALLIYGTEEKELWGGEANTTNNRMELTAPLEALKALKRPLDVSIYTDSQYVQKGMTQWIHTWKANHWKTAQKDPVKNADLWQTLDTFCQKHRVSWHWVRGHDGHVENERVDSLARQAIPQEVPQPLGVQKKGF